MDHMKVIIVCLLFTGVKVWGDDVQESADCRFWHELAHNLTEASRQSNQNMGMLSLNCNSTCSELTCTGHLTTPAELMKLNLDLCFGLRLNHCDKPVSMDFYIDLPSLNISRSGSFSHNDSLEVPGPVFAGKQGTIIIAVELTRYNSSHIMFGVTGKVRIQIAGLYMFPYQESVFPPTLIDVPSCAENKATKTPFLPPATCAAPPAEATTPKDKGGVTVPSVIKSKTYNTSCEVGLNLCSSERNEMCTISSRLSRSGTCLCIPGAAIDSTTGFCELVNKTTIGKPTPAQQTTLKPSLPLSGAPNPSGSPKPGVTDAHGSTSKQKAGINMTGVIIGAVFGALLLIVVIVSIIIYIGRRKRQANYRGSHHLLTDDDDDDDTNVVI